MFIISTKNDLVAFFNHYTSATRAKIVTRTPVKMNKRDVATKTIANPHGDIFKVQTIEVDINFDYAGKVNDARLLEGDVTRTFTAEERKWGVHINKAIIEKDEGQFYLNVVEIARIGNAVYEQADGTRIDYTAFQAFVPAYTGSVKQALEDEVKVRTFKLENIIGLNIDNKVRYVAG